MRTTREIVAGGPGDFMTVCHLSVAGSQTEIGRVLAAEARCAYGWHPVPADPGLARARLDWFARHWPQHHARIIGAAEALGVDPATGEIHLDGLTGVPTGSACSATWYAPSATVEGHGLVGRNYDFFTLGWGALFALLSGEAGPEGEPPVSSRPYVITSCPDDGPATTVLTMNELDGCMEGINEHGLAVVLLLADVEGANAPVDEGPQVGVSSVQLPRFVLDTCATAEQAARVLREAPQYDWGMPLHYLIADASGHAFVWERGRDGTGHVVEADGMSLCVTNHLVHRRPDPAAPPRDSDETLLTYERLEVLTARARSGPLSASRLRETLDEVRFDARNAGRYPVRTLWRTVFDLDDQVMWSHFYLGDHSDGTPRYSA